MNIHVQLQAKGNRSNTIARRKFRLKAMDHFFLRYKWKSNIREFIAIKRKIITNSCTEHPEERVTVEKEK